MRIPARGDAASNDKRMWHRRRRWRWAAASGYPPVAAQLTVKADDVPIHISSADEGPIARLEQVRKARNLFIRRAEERAGASVLPGLAAMTAEDASSPSPPNSAPISSFSADTLVLTRDLLAFVSAMDRVGATDHKLGQVTLASLIWEATARSY